MKIWRKYIKHLISYSSHTTGLKDQKYKVRLKNTDEQMYGRRDGNK